MAIPRDDIRLLQDKWHTCVPLGHELSSLSLGHLHLTGGPGSLTCGPDVRDAWKTCRFPYLYKMGTSNGRNNVERKNNSDNEVPNIQ